MGFEHQKNSCNVPNCHTCDTEYACSKKDACPDGVAFIPGSGKLTERPVSDDNVFQAGSCDDFLRLIRERCVCPNTYDGRLCLSECCQFSALSHLNFINGDLIINDPCPSQTMTGGCPYPKYCGTNPCSVDILDIFPNLLGVNGSIYVVNTKYRRITGFERLRYVTGSIVFVGNDNLIQLPTFPSLLNVAARPLNEELEGTYKSGLIVIANNAILRDVAGFEALRQVQKGIIVASNPCLTRICGFIHLYRTDNILIADNAKLSKVIGFCYVDTVNENLFVTNNNSNGERDLVISGFVNLEKVENLLVGGNRYLRHFKLDNLVNAYSFIVRGNSHLESLSSSLKNAQELIVERNNSLLSISFPQLSELDSLRISSNCALQCLDSFEELKRAGNEVIIADNASLVDLKGFGKLKYIGSAGKLDGRISPPACDTSACDFALGVTWGDLYDRAMECPSNTGGDPPEDCPEPCSVTDHLESEPDFFSNLFTTLSNVCTYELPDSFFASLCNTDQDCVCASGEACTPTKVVNASLVIYRNSRLRAVGGFGSLKHVEGSIFVVENAWLHTINAFGQLAYSLDIWIRNNESLKYVFGFGNLLSVRNFIVYDTPCLLELNNLKSLEYAQVIAIEAKFAKAVKLPKCAVPTVLGYIVYYCFSK